MTIPQNYSFNCLYRNIQDTTFNVEQEQPSTNANTSLIGLECLVNFLNEENSAFFEEKDCYTNPTSFNEFSFNCEEIPFQELPDYQFEQPIIHNNKESRQCKEK